MVFKEILEEIDYVSCGRAGIMCKIVYSSSFSLLFLISLEHLILSSEGNHVLLMLRFIMNMIADMPRYLMEKKLQLWL